MNNRKELQDLIGELEKEYLITSTANQRRSIAMKIRNAKKKLDAMPKIQELVTELDEFFEIMDDEEQLDLETQTQKLDTVLQEAKADEAQRVIDASPFQNQEIISGMQFFKNIYVLHPEFNDSFLHFSMKLRYFMMAENLSETSFTAKKQQKFVKLYPNLDIKQVADALGMPFE